MKTPPKETKYQLTLEQAVKMNEVLENLDFSNIAKCMAFLGWKWGVGIEAHVPDADELVSKVIELSMECYSNLNEKDGPEQSSIGTGGFYVEASKEGNELDVKFVLDGWSTAE